MKLGEKIKAARKLRKITQNELAGDKITRNMVSRIESGTVNPSLDTLRYISDRLSLPVSYLLSEDDDLFFFEKNEKIKVIYEAYSAKEYTYCINKIRDFSSVDSELAYIACSAAFELGKESVLKGALQSAQKHFNTCEEYSKKTVFDTRHITTVLGMYRAVALNIQSPLLEFDADAYTKGLYGVFDYEVYKYLTQDYTYAFKDESIVKHIKSKQLIRERRYSEALSVLHEAKDFIIDGRYNSFILFSIYFDIEQCYKQLRDFENAYKYASKRMSMLEGFKS